VPFLLDDLSNESSQTDGGWKGVRVNLGQGYGGFCFVAQDAAVSEDPAEGYF